MKIRNGFVSNSSSSSYLLVFNQKDVLEDPQKIIDFIRDEPDTSIVFFGKDLNEGDDIFEVSEEMKSLIRRFPETFLENIKDGVSFWDFSTEDSSVKKRPLKAYVNAQLVYNDNFYDPSDEELKLPEEITRLGNPIKYNLKTLENLGPQDWFKELCDQEIAKKGLTDPVEIKEFIDELSQQCIQEYYKKRCEVERDYLKNEARKTAEKIMKKGNFDSYETVQVDNYACSIDNWHSESDFAERYLTVENLEDYYSLFSERSEEKKRPYLLTYDSVLYKKEEILERIKILRGKVSSDYYLFARYSKVMSSITKNEGSFEFFRLGEKEIEYFLKKEKEFLDLNKEFILFTNASIYIGRNAELLEGKNEYELGYGFINVNEAGANLKDFKKLFKKSEERF